jgi:hypothetical protein
MAPSVDPAIVGALNLDAGSGQISPHGGSGFSSTFKITGKRGGQPVSYFVKTGAGPDAEVMFRGQLTRCCQRSCPPSLPTVECEFSDSNPPGMIVRLCQRSQLMV